MKSKRALIAITVVNLALLLLTVVESRTAVARTTAPVLRGRALELVDERGQVRTRINVEPSGEVVLRLLDQNGTIRVKLGADENGSGLVLLDETTAPGIHMIARRSGVDDRPTTTSISLTGADGAQQTIEPWLPER